jgi:hypothetical protein
MHLFPLYQFLTDDNANYDNDTDRDEFSLVNVNYIAGYKDMTRIE